MPKMIQIRRVPDELHRQLKARAALQGMSLSDYLRREVELIAERSTLAEIKERLAGLPAVNPIVPPAEVIRAERDKR